MYKRLRTTLLTYHLPQRFSNLSPYILWVSEVYAGCTGFIPYLPLVSLAILQTGVCATMIGSYWGSNPLCRSMSNELFRVAVPKLSGVTVVGYCSTALSSAKKQLKGLEDKLHTHQSSRPLAGMFGTDEIATQLQQKIADVKALIVKIKKAR